MHHLTFKIVQMVLQQLRLKLVEEKGSGSTDCLEVNWGLQYFILFVFIKRHTEAIKAKR